MNTIYDRLGTLLIARCGVASGALAPLATLEELGFDSLDYITLAMAMQEEFGVLVDDAELTPDSTLTDAVRLVEDRLANRLAG